MSEENKNIESGKPLPEETKTHKALPTHEDRIKELPPTYNPENVITVGKESIEIKPTKLKYQRDRTAAFYRVIDMYPLPDILAMDEGVIDPERDGDKAVFDWCIAATDNPKFVSRHYDEMDTEVIDRLLKIFKRLNKIDEKDEQAKNRMAKETTH